MIVLEDEAGKIWCPKVRRPAGGIDVDSCCIGSRCMAWRRIAPLIDGTTGLSVSNDEAAKEIANGAKAERFFHRHESWGYCGLAGVPI